MGHPVLAEAIERETSSALRDFILNYNNRSSEFKPQQQFKRHNSVKTDSTLFQWLFTHQDEKKVFHCEFK